MASLVDAKWIHVAVVAALSVVSGVLSSEVAATDANPERVEVSIVADHGRSAAVLRSGDRPICVFYGHGTIDAVMNQDTRRRTWNGVIEHELETGERHRYSLRYQVSAPELISINGRLFRIPLSPVDEPDATRAPPWFVLTSYGRPIATGRYFSVPTPKDLDPKSQYSHAWYFSNDVYAAESQRNTLEMDDLTGWVIAWDEQHCIQHSDGARVAKLRVFGDGRVIVNEEYRGSLVEKQISTEEVQQLRERLLAMGSPVESEDSSELDDVTIDHDAVDLLVGSSFPSTLRNYGMWDQYQDLITVRTGEKTDAICIVHPGPSDSIGRVPPGWEAVRDKMSAIMTGRPKANLTTK